MRIISGMMLAAGVGLAIGCGSNTPPAAEPTSQLAGEPNTRSLSPEPSPQPDSQTHPVATKDVIPGALIPVPVPASAAGWELDPTKHQIPSSPVYGRLAGATFSPEAQFLGDALRFRVLKEGFPERQVTIQFSPERAKTVAEGLKLTVRPEQPPGPDVPTVMAQFPASKLGEEAKIVEFANGYALTLELGKRQENKLPGSIYLSLPGEETREFLVGTFTAEWVRSVTEPPGPNDAPYITGRVTVVDPAETQIKVGYVALPTPTDFALDAVQMPFVSQGRWARTEFYRPRITTLIAADAADKPARYEHTRLAPSRYLVYAAIPDGGPAVWKWVAVTPDAKLTADLHLNPTQVGKLEVTVPTGTTEKVRLAPADDPATPVPPDLFLGISVSLGLEAEAKDGPAKFDKLSPGRYEVRSGDLSGVAEIKPGETVKVDLKKK